MMALTNPLDLIYGLGGEMVFFFKIMVALIVGLAGFIIAILLNQALGLNLGQIVVDLIKFMLEGMKSLWESVISNFHFDNKRQMFALSLITFVMMIFLFMAFNVNQMNDPFTRDLPNVGRVGFGSSAVRESSSGEGSQTGTGGFEIGIDETPVSVTVTTVTVASSVTTVTYPDNCHNNVQDGNEEGINCGGSCIPCHCVDLVRSGDEGGVDCGGSCPDVCDCTPTGYNQDCGSLGYCCPVASDIPNFCYNQCVRYPDVYYGKLPAFSTSQLYGFCGEGSCYQIQLFWVTINQSILVSGSGVLDWYG